MFIPAAGCLSDRFGTKRTFLLAMGIFVAGSALCGQAPTSNELIAFRFLQGIGGGMMTPVGTAISRASSPAPERAKASAIITIPVVLAPMAGPVLGGFLVRRELALDLLHQPAGRHRRFPVRPALLQEHKEEYAQRGFDLTGLILGGVSVASVLYAINAAATQGWGSSTVVAFGLGGLALTGLFAFLELRSPYPILDLRLLARPLFLRANVMMMLAFGAFSSFLLLITLFLQELHGYTPIQAGLLQAPASIGTAITLPAASRLYGRIGPRRMLLAGFGLASLTMLPFTTLQSDSPAPYIVFLLVLRGFPFAFAAVAAQTILFGPIEGSKQGPASSIYNTSRQIAASLGVALLITVSINRTNAHLGSAVATSSAKIHAAVMGYHDAFLVSAVLMMVPLLIAIRINDRKVSDEMDLRNAQPATQGTPPVEAEELQVHA